VEQSAGSKDLDQAAVEAVGRWRFQPARRGRQPIAMWVSIPVRFVLHR
jgi:protein TonB